MLKKNVYTSKIRLVVISIIGCLNLEIVRILLGSGLRYFGMSIYHARVEVSAIRSGLSKLFDMGVISKECVREPAVVVS